MDLDKAYSRGFRVGLRQEGVLVKPSILVIDDEERIRFTFERFLTLEGYSVMTARDCREAWDKINQGTVDLTFADIILPDGTGMDVLGEIRSSGRPAFLVRPVRVPHACEELWQELGCSDTIIKHGWPAFDPMIAEADEMVIVIQVNGKLSGQITVSAKAPEKEFKKQAFACDKVQPWVEGKEIKKVISVPGKLINIVVK